MSSKFSKIKTAFNISLIILIAVIVLTILFGGISIKIAPTHRLALTFKRLNINKYCQNSSHSSVYQCSNGNYVVGAEDVITDGSSSVYDKNGLLLQSSGGWSGTYETIWGWISRVLLKRETKCDSWSKSICERK